MKQVEELNWDTSVYSTTNYTHNAGDQLTQVNQAGQIRTLEYDGFGRIWRRTTPEQGATTYSYFADDTVQTLTDARGATTTFAYNARQQPASITYGVPAGVAATSNVSFGYDAAGNRTSMTDGMGSVSYAYDQLSRMTSETRTFSGVGSFTLGYSYNLAGELTGITNPWNAQVGYTYDATGRATSVSGANYGGVSSYVNSISYRAFGLKQMAYGNGRTLSMNYDNRPRPTNYDIPGVLRLQYEYGWENTDRVGFVRNIDDQTLDRWYAYDHVGRLICSRSGTEARIGFGEQIPVAYDGPYSHGYSYDVWGNRTHIEGWGGVARWADHTYTNNRRNGMQYKAAGNITNDGSYNFSYDAVGQQASASNGTYVLQQNYDGDGLRAKKVDAGDTLYYLRSSVLGGQVVAEIYGGGVSYAGSGWWLRGYVYLGSQMVATQAGGVNWVHQDPVGKSQRITDSSGNISATIELDPFGGDTSRSTGNNAFQPHRFTSYERDGAGADDAMFRRYNRWWGAFDQADPYDGSYNLNDPQSFNRYAYVQNDPVNFVDPSGLMPCVEGEYGAWCSGGGYWGPRGGNNTGWGSDPRPGLRTIYNAEQRLHPLVTVVREEEVNHDFHSVFAGWRFWFGYFPQRGGGGLRNRRTNEQKQKDYQDCLKMVRTHFDKAHSNIRHVFLNSLPSLRATAGIGGLSLLRAGGTAVFAGTLSASAAAPLVVSTFAMGYVGNWGVNVANNFVNNAVSRGRLLGDEIKARQMCRGFLQ